MRDLEYRYLTHLAMLLPGAGITGLEDVAVVVVVAVELLYQMCWNLSSHDNFHTCIFPKLPLSSCLPLLFEWSPVFFSPSQLNLHFCLSNTLKCLASLTL